MTDTILHITKPATLMVCLARRVGRREHGEVAGSQAYSAAMVGHVLPCTAAGAHGRTAPAAHGCAVSDGNVPVARTAAAAPVARELAAAGGTAVGVRTAADGTVAAMKSCTASAARAAAEAKHCTAHVARTAAVAEKRTESVAIG